MPNKPTVPTRREIWRDVLPMPNAYARHYKGGQFRNSRLGRQRFFRRCQFALDLRQEIGIGGDDVAGVERTAIAVAVGDEATRFTQQNDAGGEVPGGEIALPHAVEPAGRDIGHFERGRAQMPQADNLALHARA